MKFSDGTVIAFSGNTFQSDFINVVTYGLPRWGASHVGIISGNILFESTTTVDLPCVILGQQIEGVQAHTLKSRIPNYAGRVWAYPLISQLNDFERDKLYSFLYKRLGTPYDMIGAFRSGGAAFSWFESKLRKPDQSALFCSEMCAAALRYINRFPTLNESKWNPNSFLRAGRKRGIFGKPERLK